MNEKYEEAKKIAEKYNQEHLLNCYEKLDEENKEKLLDQILNINFEQISELYEKTKKTSNVIPGEGEVKAISYIDKDKISEDKLNEYRKKGKNVIKEGHYAVVTMAGGQGTRLGFNGPKGTYNLGDGIKKTLFEIISDTIKTAKVENEAITIPWYVMTSRENNADTVKFFKENNYFGLPESDVDFFIQGELPMVGKNGKILIDETGIVKEAADGHGGVFSAMYKDGIVEDMQKRGIEWVFIAGVDNILAKIVDPIATGIAIDKKVLATGKSVVKANAKEKVGVFCKKNNKPYVIEYSEITDEMAEMINGDGELIYGESHILCNLFNIKAIESMCKSTLPYHSAFKKAKYINEYGELVVPTEPNAFKFESFMFDAFERLDDMAILRVKREEEFAPIKNAEGVDSPETARRLYLDFMGKDYIGK